MRNLSCTFFLSSIAVEFGKIFTTYGVNSYPSRGIIIVVDHAADLVSSRIAAKISALGYPAKVLETAGPLSIGIPSGDTHAQGQRTIRQAARQISCC